MPPLPRESRLNKTALLFLAAASVAFFVCAQASAIQIVTASPSTSYWNPYNISENTSMMASISTDVDFKRVGWSVNGAHKWNDPGTANGPDTTSVFTPSFKGLGKPWGLSIKVVATAYDNNNVSVSETMYFRVWSPSNNISILSMSGSSDVVVGESFEADLKTNAGFGRVEWYLKEIKAVAGDRENYGDLMDTVDGPWYKADFSHTFEKDDGSNRQSGKAYRITAIAYDIANSSGAPVDTDISQIIVNVHEDKGKRAISGDSYIYSYFYIDPDAWTCQLDWKHGITYYNDHTDPDDSKAHLYAWVKVIEALENGRVKEAASFRSGDKENGVDSTIDLVLNLDRTFKGSVYEFYFSKFMKSGDGNFSLEAGRKYKLEAIQTLKDRPGQPDWTDLLNGVDGFVSQTRRFDPDDEFEGDLEWVKGSNDVYEE